jgi:hypothetical protein
MTKPSILDELEKVKSVILILSEVREEAERRGLEVLEDIYKLERMAQRELELLVGN